MSQDVILYDYWRSSAAYRVRIALALKGIDYHKVKIDLVRGEQRAPAYLARNPQGLVPVLQIDGVTLAQSVAILEYLEETRPNPPLLPFDPIAKAKMRAITLAIAADTHPISNLKVLSKVESLGGSEARAIWNRENIRFGLQAVELMLEDGAFASGDQPSMADCAIIPQIYNARRWGVYMEDMPKLRRIEELASSHPAFMAAAPLKD